MFGLNSNREKKAAVSYVGDAAAIMPSCTEFAALPFLQTASDRNATDIHCTVKHHWMVMGINAILALIVMKRLISLHDTNVDFS